MKKKNQLNKMYFIISTSEILETVGLPEFEKGGWWGFYADPATKVISRQSSQPY